MLEFESSVYDEDLDADVPVTVEILSATRGYPATYWEPGADSEIEIAVYTKESGSNCIFDTLDARTKDRLIEKAWKHLESDDDDYWSLSND